MLSVYWKIMSKVEAIFSDPFYHAKIFKWEEKKNKILEIKNTTKLWCPPRESIVSDYFRGKEDVHINYSNKIYEILKEDIDLVYRKFNVKDYYIRNSWIEVAHKNMYHGPHNHGALGLSAVCFVKYNPRYHTPTEFISSKGDFNLGNSLTYVPKGVTEGSLIVFPSRLNHFTLPNGSDVERIILSFNMSKNPHKLYVQ